MALKKEKPFLYYKLLLKLNYCHGFSLECVYKIMSQFSWFLVLSVPFIFIFKSILENCSFSPFILADISYFYWTHELQPVRSPVFKNSSRINSLFCSLSKKEFQNKPVIHCQSLTSFKMFITNWQTSSSPPTNNNIHISCIIHLNLTWP